VVCTDDDVWHTVSINISGTRTSPELISSPFPSPAMKRKTRRTTEHNCFPCVDQSTWIGRHRTDYHICVPIKVNIASGRNGTTEFVPCTDAFPSLNQQACRP
jgi:hypothetical protein